jgi:2-oxoglutarate dehydrogenase E2 component (dihydrolipoamide succinyltransferase)
MDEPLVEITTDKVNVELPSPAAGVVQELLAQEGETVPVEKVIALIAEAVESAASNGEAAPSQAGRETPETLEADSSLAAPASSPESAAGEGRRVIFSPLVRRMAKEYNLDLESLTAAGLLRGSGENGRISKQDILDFVARRTAEPTPTVAPPTVAPASLTAPEVVPVTPPTVHAAPKPAAAPADATLAAPPAMEQAETDSEIVVPFSGIRKMIADHLSRSAFTAPHVTTVAEADVTRLVAFRNANRESWEKEYGVRLTYTPFFVKAACDALLAFPMVNSTIQGDKIIAKKYVHMGVAVSLGEGGLIVPVIKDAHKKDLITLAREIEALAGKAREGKLAPTDVQGGTFSITNPGVFGAIISTPIINAPQSAILGVEAIQKRPVVRDDDSIAIRSMMYLCLSYDHRVVDGETAIRFLQHIRRTLEDFTFFR